MDLNYKAFGQGEPIIILHGLFGTLDNWQTVGKQLAEHYSVFLIDQRNHGRSPHTDKIDYPSMAQDLYQFMETQWVYKAYIMGHSMGGKTAMQFALNHPDMVEKLIVVDIAPKAYKGGHQDIFDALTSLDLEKIESRSEADEILKAQIEDTGIRQFLLKNLTRNKEGGYQWKMNLPILVQDYPKLLAEPHAETPFEKPSLFIRGGKSEYILEEDTVLIHELFPEASIKTVPEAGHWVHAEAPDHLMKLVTEFLKT